MADAFRPALENLRDAAKHLMAASQEINLAGGALVRATEAALAAKDEHEDLRETVHRLESLIIAQGEELKALRNQRNGGPQ